MRRLLQLLFEFCLHLQLKGQLLAQSSVLLGKHIVALTLRLSELRQGAIGSLKLRHLFGLLCTKLFVLNQLGLERLHLLLKALIDDDALVQGLAGRLQPLNFDVFILSSDVSFVELLVDLDVRK